MNETLAQLTARLQETATTPEKQELIAAVVADAAGIAAMSLTNPEDVEKELAHVTAQTMNLAAAEASAIKREVAAWVTSIVQTAVVGAFARA